jgi:hypothetical protein
MPLPWDTPELVRENLRVLASLKVGDKLSILKDGEGGNDYGNLVGTRGLRERFKISSSWVTRSTKGETITDRKQYWRPLIEFFQKAGELTKLVDEEDAYAPDYGLTAPKSRRHVTVKELEAAWEGLRRLKTTYDRQYSKNTANDVVHRNEAQDIVDDVKRVIDNVARGVKSHPNGLGLEMDWMQLPGAKEWWARVPSEYRAHEFAQRLRFLLETYEANKVLFQRPEDKTYRKVHLRFDLYLATEIWLKHHPAQGLNHGGHQQQRYETFHRAVDDLHGVAKYLLCKSLNAKPNNLERKIETTFGRKVGPVQAQGDMEQLETNSMYYLKQLQREKCRLVFNNGRAFRYPYELPDLDSETHGDHHQLVLADTDVVGEIYQVIDGQVLRGDAAGFVLGHDREFYVAVHVEADILGEGTKSFKHSSYFSGANVLFAGAIIIKKGYVTYVGIGSGHYKPSRLQLLHCLQALVAHGVSLKDVKVNFRDRDGHDVEGKAQRFFTTGGKKW